MQPFPSAESPKMLPGDRIAQIKLDPNSVQVLFESGLVLVVEESVEHVCVDQPSYVYRCEAWRDGPSLLHRLIQKSIVGIDRQDWSLALDLDDRSKLTVYSDDINFESGHFEYPDGSVLVY